MRGVTLPHHVRPRHDTTRTHTCTHTVLHRACVYTFPHTCVYTCLCTHTWPCLCHPAAVLHRAWLSAGYHYACTFHIRIVTCVCAHVCANACAHVRSVPQMRLYTRSYIHLPCTASIITQASTRERSVYMPIFMCRHSLLAVCTCACSRNYRHLYTHVYAHANTHVHTATARIHPHCNGTHTGESTLGNTCPTTCLRTRHSIYLCTCLCAEISANTCLCARLSLPMLFIIACFL